MYYKTNFRMKGIALDEKRSCSILWVMLGVLFLSAFIYGVYTLNQQNYEKEEYDEENQ